MYTTDIGQTSSEFKSLSVPLHIETV